MAWIFFNDAFLSIIEPPGKTNFLLVRVRVKGDITKVFPSARVEVTPLRDYRFRALIPREEVAEAIFSRILGIHYGNFKGSVPDRARHDAYFKAWYAMVDYQEQMAPRRAGTKTPSLFDDDREISPFWDDWPSEKTPEPITPCQNKGKRRRGR